MSLDPIWRFRLTLCSSVIGMALSSYKSQAYKSSRFISGSSCRGAGSESHWMNGITADKYKVTVKKPKRKAPITTSMF